MSHPHFRLICRLDCQIPQYDKYGAVAVSNWKYSIKYQVPGPGGDCSASKGPVNPYQAHRVPAATVTTTVAVAYKANIGVTQRLRWSHRLRVTTKIHQATPSFPRPAGWGRVPKGPSSGAPCPYPRRESRVVQPNELLLKGSGIKAVFSLALLPRRPYMRESSCSVGGGVDSSNHQFPRQTDRGQEHRRPPPDCKCVCESVGSHWD